MFYFCVVDHGWGSCRTKAIMMDSKIEKQIGIKVHHKKYGDGIIINDNRGLCLAHEVMVKFKTRWFPRLSKGNYAHTKGTNSNEEIVALSELNYE